MTEDIKLNTKREIPYLQATMQYFVYYTNTILTRTSRLYIRCHLIKALNRLIGMSETEQNTRKNILTFSVEKQFFCCKSL